MKNHYSTLGLKSSATPEEVRRAYRILARRYHPDVNPGKSSEERFKAIAEAYQVIIDPEQRTKYDLEFGNYQRSRVHEKFKQYQRQQRTQGSATQRFYEAKRGDFGKVAPEAKTETKQEPKSQVTPLGVTDIFKRLKGFVRSFQGNSSNRSAKAARKDAPSVKVSIVEVSVSIRDAIFGIKKTVEITEPEGIRKVSVRIPPGVRTGSVVHLRSKERGHEDLILIVRVASHPFLSMQTRGLVAEVPITVSEALAGASITVPTLDEPVVVKVPPATQSGNELRIKGKGVLQKDNTRGDLFVRLMIRVPESPEAVGIKEKATQLEDYYQSPVRETLPKNLGELEA